VRKYRFLDEYRIGETESWLSDMAARGLHLKSIGPMFARFERGEPKRMEYRVDFVSRALDYDDDMQRKLYAECGWEHVFTQKEMRIFRAPEGSGASEPHTDPAEQAFTLQRLRRRLTWAAVATVLINAAVIMIWLYVFFGPTPILSLVEGATVNIPFMVPLYLFSSISVVGSVLSTRKLIRSLRDGVTIDHRADWKRFYRTRIIFMVVILGIMAPLVIALPIATMALDRTVGLPLENTGPSLVRLSDFETDPTLERKDGSLLRGVDWDNSLSSSWSPYASLMTVVREQGIVQGRMWADGSGVYSPSIACSIYILRSSWLADGVLDDLLVFHERRWRDRPLVELSGGHGFDRLYLSEDQPMVDVFAMIGNTVVWLRYHGEEDTQHVIEALYLKQSAW